MERTTDTTTRAEPRVSVVIPLKNRRELVRETLASIQQQTCPLWEAVVVDDASTDGGPEAVAALAAEDPRIRLVHRQGAAGGAPVCRNQGFQNSKAPLVLFLDSDDLLRPTCVEQRLRVMDANPSIAFGIFLTEVFNEKPGDAGRCWNHFTDEDDLDRFLRVDPTWQTSGPIWRRESLLRVGPWDEAATKWQDWEFHIRALALRLPYIKTPIVDQLWRNVRDDSINRTPLSLHDAASMAQLMVRVRRAVQAAGMLTPERNRMFAGLFEFLMRPYLYVEDGLPGARELWRVCRQSGLVSRSKYLEGLWWLTLRRAPVLRWRIEKPTWTCFSEAKLIGSKTHLRAQLPGGTPIQVREEDPSRGAA